MNNRIITPGFEYDPAGNQIRAVIAASGTQQQYRYDCVGRLAQALDASGNVLATYTYGAGNQRLMSVEGGVTKYYAWDGGQIIAEYEAWGTNGLIWKTSYVYLGGRLLATTSGANGSETRFHHPDRLGTRLVTNASDGAVVTEQLSMPFGNMQPFVSAPGGENPYQHPTLSNPSKKRFTSYDRSEATRLDYAVNRHYSPQQGRFTQVDPIGMSAVSLGNPQTLNLYAYCGNDPINHVDPDGLFFGKLFGWIGRIFKWVARVVAVVRAVAAVLAVAWGFGVAAIKLGLAAFKFALDGWGNSKWTRILSAGIGAYFGFNARKYVIFSLSGREGASAWKQWVFAAVGALYSFLAQQQDGKRQEKAKKINCTAEKRRFFNWLDSPLGQMAKDLNTTKALMLTMAAKEGGWTTGALDHNQPLNNPFGVNTINSKGQAAGNVNYSSLDAATQYWKQRFGDRVRGAQTPEEFINGLQHPAQGQPYNSADPNYETKFKAVYNTMLKYMDACGIQR